MPSISDPTLFIAGGISPSTAYKTMAYIFAATGDWGSCPTEGTNLSGPRRSFFRGPAHGPAVPFMGPFMGINGRLPMLILC